MTTISILSGDFEILFDDETVGGNAVAGMRMVRRATGATTTVYTSLQLYSAVADEADAFQAMGFTNPMLPTTPNAFSMENKYFIPRSSTEFLKEGTLTCDWTNVILPDTNGNGVIRKPYTVVTDFVTGDIGRQVVASASGDTGTLLDFEVEPDGTTIAWIRPDDSTPGTGDSFDDTTGTISCTGDTGTGSNTPLAGETDGVTKYTAVQAIGSVPTASEVYIIQARTKLADSATNVFQWWATDPTVSLGIISVLVRTRTQDVDIADEDLEVFARRYTSLFDQFRLNVAAGGFSALPLASAPDINNTTGYWAAIWSGGTGSAMLVGDTLDNSTGGKTGGSYVVTAVADSGATGTFEYYNVGDLTEFATTDTFTSTNRNGTINGAPTANVGGPTETGAGNGGTVTITIGLNTTVDHDGDGTNEAFSVTVDAQGPGGTGVAVADVYERIKYVTRRGSDATFWDTVATNMRGEQYRGLEVQAFTDTPTGVFTEGNDVTGQGGYTSVVFGSNIAATGQDTLQNYVMMTDQQTSLDAIINNDSLSDEAADTVLVDTAGAGGAVQQFTSPKSSPFGTFTGTQLFGARGVLYTGQHDDDGQAYTLIDDNAAQRVSPNSVTFSVENTAAGDRVLVARDTGVDGIIDKDQHGGMTAVAASSKTITVGGASLDSEVPTSGYVRVVENALQQEHKYEYTSRDTGTGIFTLTDITAASAFTSTTSVLLTKNAGPSFITEGVTVGMLVQDTINTGTYEVTGGIAADQCAIRHLYGADLIASGDAFTINETIQLYAVSDDIYDLILDTEATGTTTSNTFVQSTLFDTVVNVRQGKVILPFTQNQPVTASGASVTVVRQPDTIAV